MQVQQVQLWGFEDHELNKWPQDLKPVLSSQWPPEMPILVHIRALGDFQSEALAHPLTDGRLPEAILYVPAGSRLPAEGSAYLDATVQEGDWEGLRRLLVCPNLFEMEDMAEVLPVSFIAGMTRPIQGYQPTELPLPEEVQSHLASCTTCRQAFNRALEARLRWRRQLLCPTVEQLAAYASGIVDPLVMEHIRTCRFCSAEASVLQRELAPAWLTLALSRLAEQMQASLAEVAQSLGRTGAEAIAVLLNALLGADLQPVSANRPPYPARAGAHTRRVAAAVRQWDLQGLLEWVRSGESLHFSRPSRDLILRWDERAQAICFDSLRGDDKIAVEPFEIEMCKGEEVLWRGQSTEGCLCIPLAALTGAVEAGADQFLIWAHQQPE